MTTLTICVSGSPVSEIPSSGTFNVSVSGNLLNQTCEYVFTPSPAPSFKDSYAFFLDGVKKCSFLISGDESDDQIQSMKMGVLQMMYQHFLR